MAEHVDHDNRFLLPVDIDFEKDIVARHSLYHWASTATVKHQISYELWKVNVLAQLRDYPNNKQWTLPLGDGWQVARTGEALQVIWDAPNDSTLSSPLHVSTTGNEELLSWTYLVERFSVAPESLNLVIQPTAHIPSIENLRFAKSTAGAGGVKVNSWKLTPPWRPNSSPVKLGSFLRGQKVPLHLRGSTPIIFCQHGEAETSLVAVLVDDKWIVDATWTPDSDKEGKTGPSMVLAHLS